MNLLHRLDCWVTPRRIANVAGALLLPLTVLLGIALIQGNRLTVYAAWILWALDLVAAITLTAVHFADRRHARREAERRLAAETARILAAEHERIGDLY